MIDSTSNSLPSPFKTMALPITSPNSKLSLTSPKRGQKREEGWKEVVRRLAVVLCCLFTLQPSQGFQVLLYLHAYVEEKRFFFIQHQTCFDLWMSVDVNYNPQFPVCQNRKMNNEMSLLPFEDQRSCLCQPLSCLGSWAEEAATSQPSRT